MTTNCYFCKGEFRCLVKCPNCDGKFDEINVDFYWCVCYHCDLKVNNGNQNSAMDIFYQDHIITQTGEYIDLYDDEYNSICNFPNTLDYQQNIKLIKQLIKRIKLRVFE